MFKDYLSNINNINMYAEGLYLLSDFTIGFELEGWGTSIEDVDVFRDWSHSYFKNKKNVDLSTARLGYDSSIHPDDEMEGAEECPDCSNGYINCEYCGGSGRESVECPDCDGSGNIQNSSGESEDCPTCDGEGSISEDCDGCHGRGEIPCETCDGTGTIASDRDERTLEWRSPIFTFTYENLGAIIDFLDEAVTSKNINTNDTCGFHIHIGFPDKRNVDKDMFWVLCQIASLEKTEMLSEIKEFKGYRLYHNTYANTQTVEIIQKSFVNIADEFKGKQVTDKEILDLFIKTSGKAYTSTKYVILRQHPQGTLEWRGPRRFLDSKERRSIKQFILKKLYPFIKWINDALELKYITVGPGIKISKESLYNAIDSGEYPQFNERTVPSVLEKKHDDRFAIEQDRNILERVFRIAPWLSSNSVEFSNAVFSISDDGQIIMRDGTWNKGHFKEGMFTRGHLNGGVFSGTLILRHGTIGDNVVFKNATINTSSQQIINNKLVDCSFSGRRYLGNAINTTFFGGHILGGIFENCIFKNCNIDLATGIMFDNCIIDGATLQDISIRQLDGVTWRYGYIWDIFGSNRNIAIFKHPYDYIVETIKRNTIRDLKLPSTIINHLPEPKIDVLKPLTICFDRLKYNDYKTSVYNSIVNKRA